MLFITKAGDAISNLKFLKILAIFDFISAFLLPICCFLFYLFFFPYNLK